MKCDTRLLVFRQEFQVHSMVLKLHSAFFRKFIDSAEKKDQVAQDGFSYNWTTSVDEDQKGWHLISTNDYKVSTQNKCRGNDPNLSLQKPDPYGKFKGDMDGQQNRFEELLCAFYTKPYVVSSIDQLSKLTDLADYYCCLRVLSNTVNGAILASYNKGEWYRECSLDVGKSLTIATKLRNSLLFREALIFSVSRWDDPSYKHSGIDTKLKKIAEHAYNRIALLVANFYQNLLDVQQDTEHGALEECAREASDGDYNVILPLYFRLVMEKEGLYLTDSLRYVLAEVLECNLAFNRDDYTPGKDDHDGDFFCATIDDDELPWDVTEVDW